MCHPSQTPILQGSCTIAIKNFGTCRYSALTVHTPNNLSKYQLCKLLAHKTRRLRNTAKLQCVTNAKILGRTISNHNKMLPKRKLLLLKKLKVTNVSATCTCLHKRKNSLKYTYALQSEATLVTATSYFP